MVVAAAGCGGGNYWDGGTYTDRPVYGTAADQGISELLHDHAAACGLSDGDLDRAADGIRRADTSAPEGSFRSIPVEGGDVDVAVEGGLVTSVLIGDHRTQLAVEQLAPDVYSLNVKGCEEGRPLLPLKLVVREGISHGQGPGTRCLPGQLQPLTGGGHMVAITNVGDGIARLDEERVAVRTARYGGIFSHRVSVRFSEYLRRHPNHGLSDRDESSAEQDRVWPSLEQGLLDEMSQNDGFLVAPVNAESNPEEVGSKSRAYPPVSDPQQLRELEEQVSRRADGTPAKPWISDQWVGMAPSSSVDRSDVRLSELLASGSPDELARDESALLDLERLDALAPKHRKDEPVDEFVLIELDPPSDRPQTDPDRHLLWFRGKVAPSVGEPETLICR